MAFVLKDYQRQIKQNQKQLQVINIYHKAHKSSGVYYSDLIKKEAEQKRLKKEMKVLVEWQRWGSLIRYE